MSDGEKPVDLSALASAFSDWKKDLVFSDEVKFPLTLDAIQPARAPRVREGVGRWCMVRPVKDTKTYLGVYLGDLPLSMDFYVRTSTKTLILNHHTNPALFVPDLKRVVWGVESWWGFMDRPEQLRQISDADIQNVWYVRALKDLAEQKAAE
jgi:hypothetical protein